MRRLESRSAAESAAEARILATAGTKPSLMKESFLVRLPMMRFLRSRRALTWTWASGEERRGRRSEWWRAVAGESEGGAGAEAEAEVGIVSQKPVDCHVKEDRRSEA